MNPAPIVDPPEGFAKQAVPLLKEYLNKRVELRERFRSLRSEFQATGEDTRNKSEGQFGHDTKRIIQTEFQSLEQYFIRIQPAVMNFSQQVSGMIDQGRVSSLTRSELRRRLAELESVVVQLVPLINAYRPH